MPDSAKLEKLWFTRCPVPTATGLAYRLGWLEREFVRDGVAPQTLQETPELNRHHYDHELTSLIREAGNLLALAARAQGAPTRLIGLTWIDEWQSILVRPGSGITDPKQLKGLRVALPSFIDKEIRRDTRGRSIARGMTLAGFKGALNSAGLGLDDVNFVEISNLRAEGAGGSPGARGSWSGIEHLMSGEVDAVYVKGAAAVDKARELGAVVGINLDALPVDQTLRAADCARSNLAGVRSILEGETRGGARRVITAYGDNFHQSLHPDLSTERLELFRIQKQFMLLHGLLDADFDFDAWVDHRPLEAARKLAARAAA